MANPNSAAVQNLRSVSGDDAISHCHIVVVCSEREARANLLGCVVRKCATCEGDGSSACAARHRLEGAVYVDAASMTRRTGSTDGLIVGDDAISH